MHIFQTRAVRRTTIISTGLTALLVGLFFAHYGANVQYYWLPFVLCLTPLLLKRRYGAIVAVILMGLFFGIWRGQAIHEKLSTYDNLYGRYIAVYGIVTDDPALEESNNQTQFNIGSIRLGAHELVGRIRVTTREKVQITRGDKVLVSGKLRASKGTTRQGVVGSANIRILTKNNSFIEKVRMRFFAAITLALPEPQASLGLGYLVGASVDIPKELEDQLSVVGLTHIVAVSGYNLTIIVQAVRRLVGKRSAYQSVVFAGLLVAGFLIVTGGSAPIVRAAVVCAFSLVAWYFGRVIQPLLLLLISGALTAFFNPLYVWGDPGWYLSFLAFGGVLIVAPLVTGWLFSKRPLNGILQILAETLCAQICTVPYTLYLFGGVSLIAPLANVVVLPFIPVVMFLVFITGIVGLVAPAAASLIGAAPSAILVLQIWFIQKLSVVPGARLEGQLSAYGMAIFFLIILTLIVILTRRAEGLAARERGLVDADLV